MTDGGILDGLDKATGGDGSGAKAKKGKKKTKPLIIVAGVGAAVLVYYLYSKHQANTAASSATTGAIDPATGVPYADETGYNAIDPSTGVPYSEEVGSNGSTTSTGTTTSSDPLQTVDPNSSSGETYAQEIASAASGGIDPATGQTLSSEIGATTTALTGLETQISSDPTALTQNWESGLNSALQAAGVSPDQAAQDVQNYVNGLPLNTAAAVSAVNTYVANAGFSPTPGGSSLVAVLANGVKSQTSGGSSTGSGQPVGNSTYKAPGVVDNPGGGTDAAAVAALTKANATLAKERSSGTAAQIAAAQKNAQNAAKTVESRNAAAKK
jgi:hypothetical protein